VRALRATNRLGGREEHTARIRACQCAAAVVAVVLSVAFLGPGLAVAGMGASATPTFPTSVLVGDSGIPATIQVENKNTPPNTSSTVCNAGDGLPCPVGEPGITLIPSCGELGLDSKCTLTGADPGVFQLSATAIGMPGSECAGMAFDVSLVDVVFGEYRFTPENGAHVQLAGPGSVCKIGFTFNVLKVPTIDQDPATPGQQTAQVVANLQHDGGPTTGSGRGTSTGITVLRAQPSIATIPSSPIPVGGGQLADSATVSGRINPLPGATVDFRAYGPNNATCAGPPAFESLGVPYPVAGGAVTSAAFTPTSAGVYHWIATYSGDGNNLPVSGACNDITETVTVPPATPSISTTPTPTITVGRGQLADSATVLGLVNPQPGASIDFRLYGPNDATCTGPPVFQSLSVPYPVTGGAVTSAAYTPTVAGVYRWIATYSGDANNASVSGLCSDASETVTVTPPPSGSEAPPPGSSLPATGSPSDTLLFVAVGLSLIGLLFVGSTRIRRGSRATA
jgi:LPXTG-motif cell wall-anchored protein